MKNTIELNGNLYDAATGKMIGTGNAPRPASNGGNIDGFFRARAVSPTAKAIHKVPVMTQSVTQPVKQPSRAVASHAKAHTPQVSHRVHSDVAAPTRITAAPQPKNHHIEVNHAVAHKPQSAITLMRTAVRRPSPSLRQQANAQGALAHSVPGLIEVKHNAAAINTDRLVRAGSVPTSPLIAHHAREHHKPAIAVVAPLAVQPVPMPVKPEGDVPSTVPAPQPPTTKPQDIFDHALANAANFLDVREHRAHFRKHTRRHVTSMVAGTFALLLIAIFAVYQNSPGIQLKIASVQAGVSTNMPNFTAAGFAYNGVKAGGGKLTVGFSNKDGNYQLVQQTTNWSSKDMIQNASAVDASGNPNYTTVQAGPTTVYRFSNTNAMWVSGGKWYSVSGTGALSNNQVRSIVENV